MLDTILTYAINHKGGVAMVIMLTLIMVVLSHLIKKPTSSLNVEVRHLPVQKHNTRRPCSVELSVETYKPPLVSDTCIPDPCRVVLTPEGLKPAPREHNLGEPPPQKIRLVTPYYKKMSRSFGALMVSIGVAQSPKKAVLPQQSPPSLSTIATEAMNESDSPDK